MRNPKVHLVIGLLISAVFLYIVLKPVKPDDLWNAVRSFRWGWAVPVIALTFLSMYVRAIRWHYLLRSTAVISPRRLFSPLMAGFGVNSILPGRAGEFARAYVLGRRDSLSFSAVFATVIVERIFDSLMLLVLLAVTLTTLNVDPNMTRTYAGFTITGAMIHSFSRKLAIMCFVLLAGAVVILLPAGRRFFEGLVNRATFLPEKIRATLTSILHGFAKGLGSLRDWKASLAVIVLSAAVWVIVGWSMQVVAFGFEGMHMTLAGGIALTVIICIAIVIPAAPGYWGLIELGTIFGMAMLGIELDTTRAVGYALIMHSLQYFPILGVGLYCLWSEHVSVSDIAAKEAKVE